MNVFWRCDLLYTMFLKALSTPTFVEISRLRGLAVRREHGTHMESCAFIISYWSRVSDACRLSEEVLECALVLPT